MKVLLIEDDQAKRAKIKAVLTDSAANHFSRPNIVDAPDLSSARRELLTQKFDLIVFDMYLPDVAEHSMPRDCSEELITEFSKSKNYQTEAIALTQFPLKALSNIKSFNIAGITVVEFDESNDWAVALGNKRALAEQQGNYDYLIFCALSKERDAFNESNCLIGEMRNLSNLNCKEITIDSARGLIITPRDMGLVNMAICATKAIELFQPKFVAMSGICAGMPGEANYLDIIVGKVCWNYQEGKWKDNKFTHAPQQVSLEASLQVDLEQLMSNGRLTNVIRDGFYESELKDATIRLAPIVSGSAVVADEIERALATQQHRKLAGLEMEMYALYQAAEQSLCKPLFFGAKTVVDMGDGQKNDRFHQPACVMAARFVTEALRKLTSK